MPPVPIVLFDEAYWRSVIGFDALIEHGMIAAEDMRLLRFAEDAEGLWARLLECGLRPGERV
jgi:predicted Rossmann-fold nucleotide-binding protein